MNAEKIVKDFCHDVYRLHFDEMLFVCLRGITVKDNVLHFNDNKIDDWNDTIWLFDKKYNRAYDGTVDAGKFWVENPMGKNGAVHILPGITRLRLGSHRGQQAFVQIGDVLVYRDTSHNGTWEHRYMSGGSSRGINLHPAHDLRNVGRDSAGCSVPKLTWQSKEWTLDFIARANLKVQKEFLRVYINSEEISLYIGEKYGSNPPTDWGHVLYENRQKIGIG
jgi:hypothetical protein